MTIVDHITEPQRFVFREADWDFYQQIRDRIAGRGVFVTYHKGVLEVVTTSFLHERISFLIYRLLTILAEETRTPMVTAGRATLSDRSLDEGVEADTSFYIAHAAAVKNRKEIDLAVDPPPDLAIEVEVTRRLGARRQIYRDIGVPELWRFAGEALHVMVRESGEYVEVSRSPTFPQLAPADMAGFVVAGVSAEETEWAVTTRVAIRAKLGQTP